MNINSVCFIIISVVFAINLQAQQSRQSISFNSGWFFHKGDVDSAEAAHTKFVHWQPVLLPHTWNDKDVLADNQRGYYRGIGWYKRSFVLQPLDGKRHFLRFEGVNQECEVYINGQLAGGHIGGYTAFHIDITPFLSPSGGQTVAVKVDNSFNEDIPPLTADFTFFGGVYRPVHLVTTNEQSFSMNDHGASGIYISTPEVDAEKATVNLIYHLSNYSDKSTSVDLLSRIKDDKTELLNHNKRIDLAPRQDTVVEITIDRVTGYELWSPSSPNMYYLQSSIVQNGREIDQLTEPLGFRWFRFDADSGFYLNGEPLKLMGANRHQDRIPFGNALTYDMHKQDMHLLKDMGGNFFRTAHYPQAKEVLDMADELGLIVWEEIPLVNEVTRNQAYSDVAHEMLREMIKQHHNHPSIVIWAYMNEIYWAHRFKPEDELPSRNEYTVQLATSLEQTTREMDPYRYTAMAMHNYPAYEETGIGDIPMIAGWNLYHGWYYDTFEDFGKFMDEEKRKHPHRIHIISEFGAGAHMGIYSDQPERFDFSVEGQVDFTQSIIRQIQERPYIAGGALWNLVDFSSESRVDATPHINNKGLVTADRKPKDAYLLTKALFSEKPVVELGYPFRHEWVYASKSEGDTVMALQMHVFSNLPSVELFVNGESAGFQSVEYGKATWTLNLPEGKHTLSLDRSFGVAPKDIQVKVLPYKLLSKNLDLAVNLGANYVFIDERTGLQWIEEQEYTADTGWGVIGGERLYVANKIGTKEDILSVVYEDGLYQTMRNGIEGFQADVPDGVYEIELLMVDYVSKSRRFVDDKEVNFKPGVRVFDIAVNNQAVVEKLDLGGDYGQNVPVRLSFKQTVSGGEGLKIAFSPVKRKPVLSAIRIRSVSY